MFLEFDCIDSTNAEAKRLITKGKGEDSVIIWAKEQSAGYARHGKKWDSPAGNLYFSIILEPDFPMQEWHKFSTFISCVLSSVVGWTLDDPEDLSYKWPNDILVSGRKVAGLLLEHCPHQGRNFIIIGCGVNLISSPSDTEFPATFLKQETDFNVEAYGLLSRFLSEYDVWWQLWHRKGFLLLVNELNNKLYRKGSMISLREGHKNIEGHCLGLNDDGLLKVATEEGEKLFHTGKVFFPDISS